MLAKPRFAGQVGLNLMANLVQAVLGVALIPLATRVLGPEDYGVYGLAVVLAGLVVALCETGAAYVLYAHHAGTDGARRSELLSSLIMLSVAVGAGAAGLLAALWPLVGRFDGLLASLTSTELALLCLVIPCRTLWSILSPILVVQGRSHWLAASLLLQTAASFSAVVVALYLFGAGREALFWGQLAGGLGSAGLGLAIVLPEAMARPRLAWLRKVVAVAPGAWLTSLADNLRATLESGAVSRQAGGVGLGLYNHAKLYHGMLMQGTNSFANVLWPVALEEVRDGDGRFLRIRAAWDVVYAGLTLVGLLFAFYGERLVHLLTHGKFDAASAWMPFLVVYLLIQNAGKPATAVLYATDRGNTYSAARLASLAVAYVLLLLAVPRWGIDAAVAVAILESLVFRGLVRYMAARVRYTPFQDQGVALGAAVIIGAWTLERFLPLGEGVRLAVMLGLSLVVAAATLRRMSNFTGRPVLTCLAGMVKR